MLTSLTPGGRSRRGPDTLGFHPAVSCLTRSALVAGTLLLALLTGWVCGGNPGDKCVGGRGVVSSPLPSRSCSLPTDGVNCDS